MSRVRVKPGLAQLVGQRGGWRPVRADWIGIAHWPADSLLTPNLRAAAATIKQLSIIAIGEAAPGL